ncbi:hypothetical protein GGI42DRAFT_340924 [Trichoderma sp. SZMC 28013]
MKQNRNISGKQQGFGPTAADPTNREPLTEPIDLLAILGANAQRQPIQNLNLHRTCLWALIRRLCRISAPVIARSCKDMGCLKLSHFADISHLNHIPDSLHSIHTRAPTLASRIKHQAPTIVSDVPFRNPASLSDVSAQSHPHKQILLPIKRNFYQSSPLIARAVERSLKFRCLRLSISLARAIFAMERQRASMQRETALSGIPS